MSKANLPQGIPETGGDGGIDLADLVASATDAIIGANLDGIVEVWNPAAERILGYTASQMIGRSADVLIPDDQRASFVAALDRVKRGEHVETWRAVRVRRDGRRIIAAITLSPIRNAAGALAGTSQTLRDLTQKAELDEVAAAIVASSDDAIVGKDMQGIVRTWNRGAERVFGYSAEEMIGQSILVLLPPEREDEELAILERLRRGERVDRFQTVRRRKDGELIDVSVTISPIQGPNGQVVGASKIARDITAIKRLSRERERLLLAEQAARRSAEHANRAKDEFLATLSHELRTPLNAILGWTQLLHIGTPAIEDYRHAIQTIDRNARAQTRLIEELLDMSRITTGQMRVRPRSLDLRSLVVESVDSMRPAAAGKGVELSADLDGVIGTIHADPDRLSQVMSNLLSNALRHTPKGGRITVALQRVNSHVRITISDTGEGFSPDFAPKLFTAFSQADATTTRRHGGLGLGLAIVRRLVELHGGTVAAESPGEGLGATFIIDLPVRPIAEPQTSEAAQQSVHPASDTPPAPDPVDQTMNLRGIKVLVVDDEPDARTLLSRTLAIHHAEVISASSAARAMELLVRERPDVLLSDIGMPDQDGYHLLEQVRALPRHEGGETPAVALTAFAGPGANERARAAGFQSYIAKPAATAELVAAISNLVRGEEPAPLDPAAEPPRDTD